MADKKPRSCLTCGLVTEDWRAWRDFGGAWLHYCRDSANCARRANAFDGVRDWDDGYNEEPETVPAGKEASDAAADPA